MLSNQAARIIAKFGGAYKLSRALTALGPAHARNPSVIFRWTYPKVKGGTNGRIPSGAVDDVKAAARLEGIYLTPEDFFAD